MGWQNSWRLALADQLPHRPVHSSVGLPTFMREAIIPTDVKYWAAPAFNALAIGSRLPSLRYFFLTLRHTYFREGFSGASGKAAYTVECVCSRSLLPRIKRGMWLIGYYSLYLLILLFGHPARTRSSESPASASETSPQDAGHVMIHSSITTQMF